MEKKKQRNKSINNIALLGFVPVRFPEPISDWAREEKRNIISVFLQCKLQVHGLQINKLKKKKNVNE